jgi:hypothetical protein
MVYWEGGVLICMSSLWKMKRLGQGRGDLLASSPELLEKKSLLNTVMGMCSKIQFLCALKIYKLYFSWYLK